MEPFGPSLAAFRAPFGALDRRLSPFLSPLGPLWVPVGASCGAWCHLVVQRCAALGCEWHLGRCLLSVILLAAFAVVEQPSSLVLRMHREFVHQHSSSCSQLAACGLLLPDVMKRVRLVIVCCRRFAGSLSWHYCVEHHVLHCCCDLGWR